MEQIKTKIIKIMPENIDITKIHEAAQAIRDGKLVAFPTETVYGLGADALNDNAVLKIFKAKGRPFQDPLIVHVNNLESANLMLKKVPDIARELAEKFWPGPLTIIMKKSKIVSDFITSGLDTVAIRVPDHPVALSLIKESGKPIVAPSANLFSHVSPTNAKHVIDDLDGKVDIILDSGDTLVGVESTVVDVTELPVKVLRLGGITVEELTEVTQDVLIGNRDSKEIKSPGMLKKHYAPRVKMILVEEKGKKMVSRIVDLASGFRKEGKKVGIIASNENLDNYYGFLVEVLGETRDLKTCARNLYTKLRILEERQCDIIISENFNDVGLGKAIMDRLRRAAC